MAMQLDWTLMIATILFFAWVTCQVYDDDHVVEGGWPGFEDFMADLFESTTCQVNIILDVKINK